MVRKNLLRGFKKPKGITFEHSEVAANYGRFVAYPFERGYGVTIGNTLRRILLSSIQGYAISAVKITTYKDDGSPHIIASEYEPIPEVVEDTPDFINNLKQVQVRLTGDLEEKTIVVESKGAGKMSARDLSVDNDVEIINGNFHVATLMEKANIEFEIQINLGRGYVPAERNEKYIEVIGTIPIDAIFSPIQKVKYSVENTSQFLSISTKPKPEGTTRWTRTRSASAPSWTRPWKSWSSPSGPATACAMRTSALSAI